jgi:hypothetical protein
MIQYRLENDSEYSFCLLQFCETRGFTIVEPKIKEKNNILKEVKRRSDNQTVFLMEFMKSNEDFHKYRALY